MGLEAATEISERPLARRACGYNRFAVFTLFDAYVVSELTVPFLVGVLAFLVIYLGNWLFTCVDLVLNRHVAAITVARMLLLRVPGVFVLALPIGTLLATSLVLGRLTRENEVVAVRVGGMGLWRIMAPFLVMGLAMSALAYWIGENVAPYASHSSENIVRRLGLSPSLPLIQEDKFFTAGKYTVYVRRLDADTHTLYGVMIWVRAPDADTYPRVYLAKRAKYRRGAWRLQDVVVHDYDRRGRVKVEAPVSEVALHIDRSIIEYFSEQYGSAELPAEKLRQQIELGAKSGLDVRRKTVDYHMKLAIPFACVVLALLAAPLSMSWAPAGSFVGLLLTVLLVFLYNGALGWTRALGNNGSLPPEVAAWLPNALFLAVGIVLVARQR